MVISKLAPTNRVQVWFLCFPVKLHQVNLISFFVATACPARRQAQVPVTAVLIATGLIFLCNLELSRFEARERKCEKKAFFLSGPCSLDPHRWPAQGHYDALQVKAIERSIQAAEHRISLPAGVARLLCNVLSIPMMRPRPLYNADWLLLDAGHG